MKEQSKVNIYITLGIIFLLIILIGLVLATTLEQNFLFGMIALPICEFVLIENISHQL